MDLPGTDYASTRTNPCSSGGPGSYLASGEMDEEDLKEMLPILGSTFWQSMKNKVRKSKKPSESGHSADANGKRTWDLRFLLEQEPRMWSACFRTPESFVKIADCVVSSYGIQPINTDTIDESESILGDSFVPLPNLKPAGSVTLQNDRLYISSMDLCHYYWRNKCDGSFDRQMQSWNAGRRAALREKTKSYVHIDEKNTIETEWWDVEGILTSTKVLRKFLVMGEGAQALSELARYVYQRRRFYEDTPSSPTPPRDAVSESKDCCPPPKEVPAVRKRTPSMKGADGVGSLSIVTPRKKSRSMRSPSLSSSPMNTMTPLSPHAMPTSPNMRMHANDYNWAPAAGNFGAPNFGAFAYQQHPPPPMVNWHATTDFGTGLHMYDQSLRPTFGMRQPSSDGSSTSGLSTTTSSRSVGLMLLVDAATAREECNDQKDNRMRSESRSSRSFSTDSRSFSTDSRSSEGSIEDEQEAESDNKVKPASARRPSLSAGDKLRGYEGNSAFRPVAIHPV